MNIEPGTSIISGVHSPHECTEKEYKYEKIRGTLVAPNGKKVEYNMLRCNKCGAIAMRGDKVHEIEIVYKNYQFIHVPKKKTSRPPSKKQIRNIEYITQCAIADAQGLPRPRKKGKREKPSISTPDYVLKGEAPSYMQRNAVHPYQGGSPK